MVILPALPESEVQEIFKFDRCFFRNNQNILVISKYILFLIFYDHIKNKQYVGKINIKIASRKY